MRSTSPRLWLAAVPVAQLQHCVDQIKSNLSAKHSIYVYIFLVLNIKTIFFCCICDVQGRKCIQPKMLYQVNPDTPMPADNFYSK